MSKDKLDDGPKLVKVAPGEIELGGRLMCNLYNGDRQIVRVSGQTVTSQSDLDGMYAKGLYRFENEHVHKRADTKTTDGPSKFRRGAGGKRIDPSRLKPVQPKKITDVPLDKTKVRIGSVLQLQPKGPDALKYTVTLIGYLRGQGVCVTPPSMNGEFVMIREWDGFTARFFSGKDAFAFDSSAMKQTMVPYPMLHLTYPRIVRIHQIRQKPRLQLELIAVAQASERGLLVSLRVSDLSTGGASLLTPTNLGEVGEQFKLTFKVLVEGIEVLMELVCQIRNVIPPSGENKNYNFGVSFHDVDPDMLIALSAYVCNMMLEQM
jgi:c-di-GMP-binding flagellar brake protein YcgR